MAVIIRLAVLLPPWRSILAVRLPSPPAVTIRLTIKYCAGKILRHEQQNSLVLRERHSNENDILSKTQSSVSQQMVAKRVDLWQQIGGGITYGCLGLSSTLPAVSALPCCCGIAYPTKHLRLQHSLRCCHNILIRHGGGKLYACHNRTLQSCAVQIKTVHARCQDALSCLHSFDVYSSPLQRSVYRHRGTPQTGADIECVDTGPVWLIVDTMEMNGQQLDEELLFCIRSAIQLNVPLQPKPPIKT